MLKMILKKENRNFFFSLLFCITIFIGGCNLGAQESKTEEVKEFKANKINAVFLGTEEGSKYLAVSDDYIERWSKYDYASRMRSNTPLDINERENVYRKAIVKWDDTGKQKINETVKLVNENLEKLKLNLNIPKEIKFIKTNGLVESGATYTRGDAIIINEKRVNERTAAKLVNLITHELFHIYSRHNEDLKNDLYAVINFKPCEGLEFPDELKELKITNPDAPKNEHYINLTYKGKEYSFIPILYSTKEYDIMSNDPFIKTLKDEMLAVEIVNGKPEPIYEDGKLLLVKKDELKEFYEKIGENTTYTYHPEETLADNFVILLGGKELQSKILKSKWVIDKLEKTLKESAGK